MNYTHILKRAAEITWRHRALWVFGVLLALFGGSGGGNAGGGGGDGGSSQVARLFQYRLGRDDLSRLGLHLPPFSLEPAEIGILVGVLLLIVLLVVVAIITRNLSTGALIAMVDEVEETGATNVRSGFRHGWRHWLRLFAINLVVAAPLVLAAIVLLAGALSPLLGAILLSNAAQKAPVWIGALLSIGLLLIWLLAVIIAAVAADLLLQVAYRQCVLGGDGVLASIREGYRTARRNLRDVGLTWLILFGINLVAGIILIPVILVGIALLAGVTVAAGVIGRSVLPALIIGAPALLAFIAVMVFLSALLLVFRSSVWTLTFREIVARQRLAAGGPEDASSAP